MPRKPHTYYVLELSAVPGHDGKPVCRVILECDAEALRAAPLYTHVRLVVVRKQKRTG